MPTIGIVAEAIGVIGGTMLWGYGIWWLALAIMVTIGYLRDGMPFNIGWWGFTFPLGVYAVATLALARQTHLAILADAGIVLVGLLVLLWIIVFSRTALGAWRGDLFFSPCLMSNVAPITDEADIA
jgi:tellurite resistance protein TehA-like permease